jgi:DnaJ family protein B protein 4
VAHDTYQRVGNDLVLEHKISLHDALTAKPVSFKTIEGEMIDASFDEVVTPQTMKVIAGKGMPIE